MHWKPHNNNYFYCYYHNCLSCVLTVEFNLKKIKVSCLTVEEPDQCSQQNQGWPDVHPAEYVVLQLLFLTYKVLLSVSSCSSAMWPPCHILNGSRLICGDLRLKKRSIIRLPFKVTPPYHIDRRDDLSAASRLVVTERGRFRSDPRRQGLSAAIEYH